MMVVLVMGSLYTIASQLDGVRAKLAGAETTGAALAMAKAALLTHAVTYRDRHPNEAFGYLPCPDTADKSGLFVPGDGIAAGSCGSAGTIAVGLLPYVTLGLPELRDASDNCLWYAVSGSFKNSPKAATPLNWDTRGQLSVFDAHGAPLAAPDDADGGAAAIVFAPGRALDHQDRRFIDQRCRADPAQIAAYLERQPPDFVDGGVADAPGGSASNDRLAWITPRDIFNRVVARADFHNPLGDRPAGWFNRFIDAQRKALDGRLWASMSAFGAAGSGTPANEALPKFRADYRQFAAKWIGDLPDLKPLAFAGRNYDNDFDNWQDQFRYIVCDDLKSLVGCLTLGAQTCRGALFLGGRLAGGGPRPAAATPHAPPPSRSHWLENYFEAGGALDLLDGPAMSFGGPAQFEGGSADVGVCLSPGAYTSFAKDIAAYLPMTASTAHPEAAVDKVAAVATLGNAAAGAAGNGCLWFPVPLPFDSSLRAYFVMRIADAGEGYVFAVVDSAANSAAMMSGGLCGSGPGAHLGYSGAAIAGPKFGLEIDMRAQETDNCNAGNRNDPRADHMAFVYRGAAMVATDDNCHGAGTAASGAEPLNPRTIGVSSGMRTVQASDPHLPHAGSFPLNTDIHVRVEVDKAFGGTPIRSASWSPAGTVGIATGSAHGFVSGQRVTISGVNPSAYDGTFTVAVSDATHFSYPLGADPGIYRSGGRIGAPPGVAVQSAAWSAGSVTVTTAVAHGFVSGQPVSLSGASPATYDGTHIVTVTDATRFRFERPADPGAYSAGGHLLPAVALTLRAYVASRLPASGSSSYVSTCTIGHLRDLSVDLADLCTHAPTLAPPPVFLDVDAAGQALSSVYAGFTSAQGADAAGRQSLTISRFLLWTQ